MTDTCPVENCSRPRHQNLTICTHHSWVLERAIAETPTLARELDLTITRQTGTGPNLRTTGTNEKPMPYDLHASEALAVLRSTLVGWVRELEPDLRLHPADTLDAISRWLYVRHHQLITHPAAEQAVDEITAATTNGWRTIDRRDRARFVLPDACPDCGAQLRAALHDVGDPRPNLVWCTGAEPHRYEAHQWLRLGHRLGYGREVAG